MPAYNYFPILKTTDAEIKAYENLPKRVLDGVLPVFELTQSRRSSKANPDGDIWKRIEKLEPILGDRNFILDLTTELSLQNKQIAEMLSVSADGFKPWVSFVKKLSARGLKVIPAIHYNAEKLADVADEIRELKSRFKTLAFRVSADDDVVSYLAEIKKNLDLSNLILILDAGFCRLKSAGDDGDKSSMFLPVLQKISTKSFKAVICAASSFPVSVVKYAGCGDEQGDFPIAEAITTDILQDSYGIFHGDYGSIHPVRYEGGGGGFVPRIDFPAGNKFYYYRYRRDNGGYVKAAKKVVQDSHYKVIGDFAVWGDSEIAAAAKDNPQGRSPAHWIAVRVNLYLTQQYLRLARLKKSPRLSL